MTAKSIFLLGLLSSALAVCAIGASDSSDGTSAFHATTPAGYDVLLIKPGGSVLTFLGLIECPELEGAQQITEGSKARIVTADGKQLASFPTNFSFRITASLRKTVLVDPAEGLNVSQKPEDFLLGLKFRLKIHHGLSVREVQPDSVQMIGVPADIPYDERVYRATFTVQNVPVTDRCVLEVLSPDGKPLTKFHFDLL